MMDDRAEVRRIMRLSKDELWEYVMDYPEYLTDRYYEVFGRAIRIRYKELKEE